MFVYNQNQKDFLSSNVLSADLIFAAWDDRLVSTFAREQKQKSETNK